MNYWKSDFLHFLISWKYWKLKSATFSVTWKYGRRAGGSRGCVVLPWIIFGTCFLEFTDILEILGICFFYILGFLQKTARAEISRRMVRFSRRDLSYETDSGPKTKTVSDPNFQVTAATAAAATAATSQQLSHLARALDHHAQGPNIPFGVNPSLRYGEWTERGANNQTPGNRIQTLREVELINISKKYLNIILTTRLDLTTNTLRFH